MLVHGIVVSVVLIKIVQIVFNQKIIDPSCLRQRRLIVLVVFLFPVCCSSAMLFAPLVLVYYLAPLNVFFLERTRDIDLCAILSLLSS